MIPKIVQLDFSIMDCLWIMELDAFQPLPTVSAHSMTVRESIALPQQILVFQVTLTVEMETNALIQQLIAKSVLMTVQEKSVLPAQSTASKVSSIMEPELNASLTLPTVLAPLMMELVKTALPTQLLASKAFLMMVQEQIVWT